MVPMPLVDLTDAATGVGPADAHWPEIATAPVAFETDMATSGPLHSFEISSSVGVPDGVVESARAAAAATGYAQGWAAGIAEAQRAMADRLAAQAEQLDAAIDTAAAGYRQVLSVIDGAATQIRSQHVTTAAQIQDAIIAAGFSIAESLLGQALADEGLRSRAAVARALDLASGSDDVDIRVAPADFTALAQLAGADPTATSLVEQRGSRTIVITPDGSLQPGDAVARYSASEIDARLSAAVDRVREALSL